MNPFDNKGRFTFGKFKGKLYREVAFKTAWYVKWCSANIDGFDAAVDALQTRETGTAKKTRKTAAKKPKASLQTRLIENIQEIDGALDDVPETPGELDQTTAFSPDIPF